MIVFFQKKSELIDMTVVNVSTDKIGILITTWQLLKLAFPMFLSSASWVSSSLILSNAFWLGQYPTKMSLTQIWSWS